MRSGILFLRYGYVESVRVPHRYYRFSEVVHGTSYLSSFCALKRIVPRIVDDSFDTVHIMSSHQRRTSSDFE